MRVVIEEGMPKPISIDKPTPEEIKRSEGLVNFSKYYYCSIKQ